MYYTEYRDTARSVWRMILDIGIAELPVKTSDVLKRLGLSIYSYSSNQKIIRQNSLSQLAASSDGFTILINGNYYIFYDEKKPPERIRFTLMHELGHIVCGHLTCQGLSVTTRNREPSFGDDTLEQQANVFASRILAPACVLHELKLFTADQIADTCQISRQSANFRLNRLLLLEERHAKFLEENGHGCFYLDPLERQVYEQFKPFIITRL